jgi:hypothetical protein
VPNVYQPKLIQIRPQYSQSPADQDRVENILWLQSVDSGTPTLTNLQDIQDVFDGAWPTLWHAYGSEDRSYLGSIITDWSSDTGLQNDSVGTFSPTAGTNGVPQPSQVCALISLSNGQRYRGGHFRLYLPYVGINAMNSDYKDELTASIVTSMTTAFNGVNEALQASTVLGGQNIVLYRFRNDESKAAVYPIADYTVNSIVATQRRRLRKVPHH